MARKSAGSAITTPENNADLASGPSIMLRLDQVVTSVYRNPRRIMLDTNVTKLMNSMAKEGQIQEVNVVEVMTGNLGDKDRVSTGKYAVCVGWTRTEAKMRTAFTPIIKLYNKNNNLLGQPGQLLVNNPEHRQIAADALPEETKAALEKEDNLLRCLPVPEQNVKAIMKRSYTENAVRSDLSIWEDMLAIEDMLADGETEAKDVAALIGRNSAYISQTRQALRALTNMKQLILTPESWEKETLNEEALATLSGHVDRLLAELDRRIKPMEKEEQTKVGISHLREFCARAEVKGDTPSRLERKYVLEGLCRLVGAETKAPYKWEASNKEGIPTKPQENFTTFNAWLKAMEEETANRRAGKLIPKEDVAAAAAGTAATPAAEGIPVAPTNATAPAPEQFTKEDVAAVQQQQAAAAGLPAVDDTTAASAETAAAVANEANASTLSNIGGVDLTDEGDAPPDAPSATAIVKGATQTVKVQAVKFKPEEVVLGIEKTDSRTYVDYTKEDPAEQRIALGLAKLASLVMLKDLIGRSKEAAQLNEQLVDMCDGLEKYIENLESFKTQILAKNPTLRFSFLTRPELPQVSFAGIDNTVSLQDALNAPSDEVSEDDELEAFETGDASDADLAAIEAQN